MADKQLVPREFPGSVYFGRRSTDSGERVYIELKDDNSGRRVVEIEMTLEEFALAMTGRADTKAKYSLKSLEYVGISVERETIYVPAKRKTFTMSASRVNEGWKYDGGFGQHNTKTMHEGVECYACRISRNVDSRTGKPVEPEVGKKTPKVRCYE